MTRRAGSFFRTVFQIGRLYIGTVLFKTRAERISRATIGVLERWRTDWHSAEPRLTSGAFEFLIAGTTCESLSRRLYGGHFSKSVRSGAPPVSRGQSQVPTK